MRGTEGVDTFDPGLPLRAVQVAGRGREGGHSWVCLDRRHRARSVSQPRRAALRLEPGGSRHPFSPAGGRSSQEMGPTVSGLGTQRPATVERDSALLLDIQSPPPPRLPQPPRRECPARPDAGDRVLRGTDPQPLLLCGACLAGPGGGVWRLRAKVIGPVESVCLALPSRDPCEYPLLLENTFSDLTQMKPMAFIK